MPVDASIPLSVNQYQVPDMVGAVSNIYKLKEAQQKGQMNQIALSEALKKQQISGQVQEAQKGLDLSTTEGSQAYEKKLWSIDPDTAMRFQKSQDELKNLQLEHAATSMEITGGGASSLWTQYQGMLDGKTTPQQASMLMTPGWQQFKEGLVQNKIITPEQAKTMPEVFDPNYVYSHVVQSKKGLEVMNARRQQQEFEEKKRHDIAVENISREKSGPAFTDKMGDLMAALAEEGVSLPAGLRSKAQQAALYKGLIERNPDKSAEQIAGMIKSGQLTLNAAKTEASVLGRREAAILPVEKSITKPGGFLDQAEKAVNDVDFDKLKAAGKFESWSKDQLSDPKLSRYKGAVAELRAEYALVLSKGGQVTDAARHEAAKVIPDLITKEQFKEIRSLVNQGIEASKGGVEESLSGVTGADKKGNGASKEVHWDDLP